MAWRLVYEWEDQTDLKQALSGGPPDEPTFVAALNSGKVDMVSTSGHATEHDWQMGFTYRSGQIVTPSKIEKLPQAARDSYNQLLQTKATGQQRAAARLLGVDASNKVYEILTDNPKIYYSPGVGGTRETCGGPTI